MSHTQNMPNPHALPGDRPLRSCPNIPSPENYPASVTQTAWRIERQYAPRPEYASAQEALARDLPTYFPRNIEHDLAHRVGIPRTRTPSYKEPDFPDLDFGQWERDADVSLSTLGRDSFNFGSLAGNTFSPTEEEAMVMETCSDHEKKVMKAHQQFIRMLGSHKATAALAKYDDTYDFQFYRIFQGEKTTAKRNAMNNIMGLWTELFYHRLDGKPYQPSVFMVTLHSLFGELSRRGVNYSLGKDFNHRGGFMRDLELRWNRYKMVDHTFAARPTKVKMPEDYAQQIRDAVIEGVFDPVNDVNDCILLFACACGTMLGFRGNQVRTISVDC